MCGANGKEMKIDYQNYNETNINYAYIKHFVTKSIEELIKRVSRGTAMNDDPSYLHGWRIKKISAFFKYNELTPEKLRVAKDFIISKISSEIYERFYERLYVLNKVNFYLKNGNGLCVYKEDIDKVNFKYF